MESSNDLSVLVEELGEHIELESIGIIKESDDEEDEGTVRLQETFKSLLEKTGKYAKVPKTTIKKMKRENIACMVLKKLKANSQC